MSQFMLMPLAHGALGSLDEIAGIVVGVAIAVYVVLGFIYHGRAGKAQADHPKPTEGQSDSSTFDHYRLD